ncbi:hypothetical protein Tco_0538100 [Tanacetum coccineum]
MAIVRKGKQRGHLPGVGRVLPGQGTDVLISPRPRLDARTTPMSLSSKRSQPEFGSGSGSGQCGDDEPGDDVDGGEDEEDADS